MIVKCDVCTGYNLNFRHNRNASYTVMNSFQLCVRAYFTYFTFQLSSVGSKNDAWSDASFARNFSATRRNRIECIYRAAQKQRASDTVHMTRNESANSQEHSLITTLANSIRRLPFSAAGYAYIRDSPINPALSAGLIPWWNQFTVGGCYTYRARAVIKLLLQAGRTPIDMGGHRTPTLALFPRRCIYEPFIRGARSLLITRDINESVKRHHPLLPPFYHESWEDRVGGNASP